MTDYKGYQILIFQIIGLGFDPRPIFNIENEYSI